MAAIGQLWRARERDEVIEIIDIQNKIVVAISRTSNQKVFLTVYGLESNYVEIKDQSSQCAQANNG